MARWIITNKITRPTDLSQFDASGYRWDDDESSTGTPVFKRSAAARL
jgi:cytoplasmic iron level regulating protein YaaA (DUF328/UPF0246 family)